MEMVRHDIVEYAIAHTTVPSPAVAALRSETESNMPIPPEPVVFTHTTAPVAPSVCTNTDGTFAVTMIFVRVPTVGGTVTAVTSSGFTVKQRDGSSKTITTSSSTSFLLGAAKSSKSDLSVGARVTVEGTDGSSFAADVVHIVPDLRIGKVTAVTSSSITIQDRDNTTITIHVDASTTFRVKGAAAGKLSDVTVGMYVSAQGLSRADGSLDATTVLAGALRGPKVLPIKPDPSTAPS